MKSLTISDAEEVVPVIQAEIRRSEAFHCDRRPHFIRFGGK